MWKNNSKNICKVIIFFGLFILIGLANAQSQVETLINLDGELRIDIKEGNLSAPLEYEIFINDILVGKGNFTIPITNGTVGAIKKEIPLSGSYRKKIEINDTELYLLSNALEIINFTDKYLNCSTELDLCRHDIQYESNFTTCQSTLTFCQQTSTTHQSQISSSNEEISSLKTHRIILLLLAIGLGIVAYKFYSQTVLKQAKTNWRAMFPNKIQ